MQLFIVLFFVLVGGAVDHKSWRDKSIDNKAKAIADKDEAIDKAEDEDGPPKDKDKDEAIGDDPSNRRPADYGAAGFGEELQ